MSQMPTGKLPGSKTPGSTGGAYVPGGRNKIQWGAEVTEGSSGGNTSYNAETGKVHYIAGYENDAPASTAAVNGLKSAGSGSKKKSSKPKASTPAPRTPAPRAPAPRAPAPPVAAPPTGSIVGAAGGGLTGGGAAPATEADSGGMMGMLTAMGGMQQPQVPFEPQLGPGLRPGLGQRAYPMANTALAALRKLY